MVAYRSIPRKNHAPKLYTLDEYLRREEQSAGKHEFYNGKIIKMAGGTDIHSEITTNAITSLKVEVRRLPTKYRVYDSNLKVYIVPDNISVYPDALVICAEPEYWQNRRDMIVNPILIVEVLSPSTQAYDKLGKFDLYRKLPSFQEYVLISTDTHSVETRFREEPDLWRIKTLKGADKLLELRSLGIKLALTDIYENIVFNPMP